MGKPSPEGFYLDTDRIALSLEAANLHECRMCPTILGAWDDYTINGIPGFCRTCYVMLS